MGTKPIPPRLNNHRYGNYDEFIHKDGKYIPSSYPTHVKILDDDSSLIEVNLEEGLSFENSDDGGKSLKFDGLDSLSPELKSCIVHLLLMAVNGKRKVSTTRRWSGALTHFFNQISGNCDKPIAQITLPMYEDYCRDKSANMQKNLRSPLLFLIRETPLPGITTDLTHYLSYSRTPKTKTTSDIQNTNMDETPFSIDETRRLLSTVDTLFIKGIFNEQDACLWRLLISEALRPSQIRLLKAKDVHISRNIVRLDIPMVKQHGMAARDFLNPTTLSESLSKAIILHIKFVKSVLGKEVPGDTPLFSVLMSGPTAGNPSYRISRKPISIHHQIMRTAKLINTGLNLDKDVALFSRRLKHTKLTHLAMNGACIEVLARAGFQTSTVSLKHYINITDEVFENYEKKMRDTHLLIESAFRGHIGSENEHLNNENSVVLGSDLDSRMGVCCATLCGVLAPYGCYVCPKFNAFIESDHQQVLDELLLKRVSREDLDLPPEAIARDDYIIRAVEYVIKEARKSA